MHESSEIGGVEAGLIVIEAHFSDECLSRVLEPTKIVRAGFSVFVIGIDLDDRAGVVRNSNDRPTLISDQPAAVCRAGTFIPYDRVVNVGAMSITADEIAARIIFADQLFACIE